MRGATLVESLCLVAILGILALVALPRFHLADGAEFDRSAAQLAADLRWLQQKSKNLARGHTDFKKVPKDSVPRMRITAGMNGGYSISDGVVILKRFKFVGNVAINANYTAIMFNNDGYANQPVTILLTQGTRSRKVVIDRVGRIRVE